MDLEKTSSEKKTSDKEAEGLEFAGCVVLGLILIFHFLFLLRYHAPALGGWDANGYFAQGSLLFTTGRLYFETETDVQFVGLHWLVADNGKYFCRYPPGFSLIIGLLFALFGYKGAALTNLLLASLTLVGLFLILKKELDWKFAAAGTIVLAANPIFNSHAIQGFSHIAVMCFLTWGIFFLFSWKEQRSILDAMLAGFTLGYIPTMRYPEAVYALAIGWFLLWEVRREKTAWKHVLACCGAAVIPGLFILIRNHFAFGAFWKTAYTLTKEQSAFSWEYFIDSFAPYIKALQNFGLGLFFGLGLLGMLLMCFRGGNRQKGLLYVLLVLAPTFLYMAYYWPRVLVKQDLRFLLPITIVFIFSGMWFLKEITKGCRKWQAAVLVTSIILIQLFWADYTKLSIHGYNKQIVALITEKLIETIDDEDVIISDYGILERIDFIRKWKLIDSGKVWEQLPLQHPPRFKPKSENTKRGPVANQPKKRELFRKVFEGLTAYQREEIIADQIESWAGDSSVYYLGDPKVLKQVPGRYLDGESFEILERFSIPKYEGKKGEIHAHHKRSNSWLVKADEIVIAHWKGR